MNTKKKALIVLIVIVCVFGVLLDLYHQSLLKIETGNDYESVKDLTFFVNEPESCIWVKGLGQTFLDLRFFIKYETTVVLMKYKTKEDIRFKLNAYNISAKGFKEDLDVLNNEYERLLDKVSDKLLKKDWRKVYFETEGDLSSHYGFMIYISNSEILVIAESLHMK